jgi:hypothetical protein
MLIQQLVRLLTQAQVFTFSMEMGVSLSNGTLCKTR